MKKRFFSLVLFFCATFMFAETGYRGHEWYKDTGDMPVYARSTFNGIDSWETYLFYYREILGNRTNLYYGFWNNELINAGYLIQKDKTSLLKQKLKDKQKTEYKINLHAYSNLEELLQDFKKKTKGNEEIKGTEEQLFYYIKYSYFCSMIELHGLDGLEDKANATLTIYDYNEDTRCYVLENAAPQQTVVVYLPHEQDY